MPQSLTKIFLHIIFSTKHRVRMIDETIENELFHYIKQNSSKWIKTKGDQYAGFYWQDGYAAFSVSPNRLDGVANYIRRQKEHHQKISFQDECRTLFKEHGIEYDERYVWD